METTVNIRLDSVSVMISAVLDSWEDEHISYRVQDFVEVHKTDSDRKSLEEDRSEDDEPQRLEGDRNGHVTVC